MRPLVPLFLVVLVSAFASAAPLPLGPERPLSPITPAPAAGTRSYPSVAVDGAGHALAVWSDNRRRSDACNACTSIYGSRLDESGKPLDPFGIRIRDAAGSPQVVSSGSGFLLLYSDQAGVWSLRLDADGHAIDTPNPLMAGYATVAAAVSNGRTFLVVLQRDNFATAVILDLNGRLQRAIVLSSSQLAAFAQTRIVVGGGAYHVIRQNGGCSPCTSWTDDVSIDDSGTTSTRVLGKNAAQWFQIGVAANASGMLVAWVTDVPDIQPPNELVEYEFFDWSGGSTGRKRLAGLSTTSASAMNVPLVLWDGNRFLVTWQQVVNGRTQMVGERMSAAGAVLDAAPIPIEAVSEGGFYTQGVATAQFPDATNLVVWSDGSEVWSLSLPSAGAIGTAKAQRVSYSGTLQTNLQIAGSSAVWMETSAGVAILASPAGGPPQIVAPNGSNELRGSPAVASNSAMSIVAWIEFTNRQRIMARRFSASGTMLDAQPIVIADESWPGPESPGFDNALSVATDGAGFLLVWANDAEVHASRLAANGTLIDASPIVVTRFSGGLDTPYVTRAAWTGIGWVVALTRESSSGLLISPAPFDDTIFLARITSDGLPLDTDAPVAVFDAGWASAPVSMAFADGRLALAWPRTGYDSDNTRSSCAYVRLFDTQLVPTSGAARQLFCGAAGTLLDLTVAANGSSFLVATSEQASDGSFVVRGRRVDANGNPIDTAPFDLSAAGYSATGVALSGGGGTLTVGYTRETPEAGDIGRIFLRTIAAPPRNRAVR